MSADFQQISWGLDPSIINLNLVALRVEDDIPAEIAASDLELSVAYAAASFATRHPDYALLGGRVFVRNIHKFTDKSFSHTMAAISHEQPTLLDGSFLDAVLRNGDALDAAIVHSRDFDFEYHSVCTMARSYLLRTNGRVVEHPQHAFMRIAVALHLYDVDRAIETYDILSRRLYTHASPVFFNAGTSAPAYASSFLYEPAYPAFQPLSSALDLDRMWEVGGSVGVDLARVPARRKAATTQAGVVPVMRVYDAHAIYTASLSPRRAPSVTVYLPIWHRDIREFLASRASDTAACDRLRVVTTAVWVSDIFMHRLMCGDGWTLFDPADVPLLCNRTGSEFSSQYIQYESTVKAAVKIPAATLWAHVCVSQQETGAPFLLYGDSINAKNNQRHLGAVTASSACAGIVQYAAAHEPAVCTLASVVLPRFVQSGTFDYDLLYRVVQIAVANTDTLIDIAGYPDNTTRTSAYTTRCIGVGVQGLWDVFGMLKMSPDGASARALNKSVFETVYYASLDASVCLAQHRGPYPRWYGSPASLGRLQCDMWEVPEPSGRYDYDALRKRVAKCGIRNSTLTAQVPTTTPAYVMGVVPGIEPYTSNVLTHQSDRGDYLTVRRSLVEELVTAGVWTDAVRHAIIQNKGSVQGIEDIPDAIKAIYRTAWELSPSLFVDMAVDRAPFIDQSQSLTLYAANPELDLLTALQMRAWRAGLKTGISRLRSSTALPPLIHPDAEPETFAMSNPVSYRDDEYDAAHTTPRTCTKSPARDAISL